MASDEEDFDFNSEFSDEENEEFERERKAKDKKLKTHPLYIQANEVLHILELLMETSADDDVKESFTSMMWDSATIIIAKLSSVLNSGFYISCMQQAAIIRDHAEYLRLSNHMLTSIEAFDPKYITLFRDEMEKFRELFKAWAKEIHQMDDEIEDEWGLFTK